MFRLLCTTIFWLKSLLPNLLRELSLVCGRRMCPGVAERRNWDTGMVPSPWCGWAEDRLERGDIGHSTQRYQSSEDSDIAAVLYPVPVTPWL